MLTLQAVGRFELRDFLGRGAVGDVYLAFDPQSDRELALKVVHLARTEADILAAERAGAQLQAQLAASVPQVAAVYEHGEDDGFLWVAMEYVAGTDLAAVLCRGPLPVERAVSIALELCAMLETCHAFSAEVDGRRILGVVHGDIKPENIRLQDGDRVRVLDFGIAKHLSQTRRFTVNLFGSLPYTPPERLERGVVDQQSDLWAVGVVLHIMLSGKRPFPGETAEELEGHIRRGGPPLPLPDECPQPLDAVVRRCLAADPARRYAGAAELRADLEAFRDGRPLASLAQEEPVVATEATRRTHPAGNGGELDVEATRRTRESEPVEPPPLPAVPAALPVPAPPAPRKGRFWLLAALAVLLLVTSQTWVWSQMKAVRRDLVTTTTPDVDDLLVRYRRADRMSLLGPFLAGTRDEMRRALATAADRILLTYHGDHPTTRERGWRQAADYLREAVDLNFKNGETRARLIYCEAHVTRIEAQKLRDERDARGAAAKYREAVFSFRQAAERAPDWPDPYLGLARVYAYEQFDLAKLQEALADLARRGYPLGRRETAMLADGYRMQGKGYLARAQRAEGSDDEIELLEKARDHLSQAVAFYADIPAFGNSKANRADAERGLETANDRLWDAVW